MSLSVSLALSFTISETGMCLNLEGTSTVRGWVLGWSWRTMISYTPLRRSTSLSLNVFLRVWNEDGMSICVPSDISQYLAHTSTRSRISASSNIILLSSISCMRWSDAFFFCWQKMHWFQSICGFGTVDWHFAERTLMWMRTIYGRSFLPVQSSSIARFWTYSYNLVCSLYVMRRVDVSCLKYYSKPVSCISEIVTS